MTKINLFPLSNSWTDFSQIVNKELDGLKPNSIIVEIGGGANPYLSKKQVQNFRYVVIDIDTKELTKAKGDYFEKICTDITKDNKAIKCDLIITNMLLEHIYNPKEFQTACNKMLNEKGRAIHFFATRYSPGSIINLILPEYLSRKLLHSIQKREWETEGKFPAYYRWCMGPTKHQIARFKFLGYNIELFYGYLGSGYLSDNKHFRWIEKIYNFSVLKLKHPIFCSNAILILSKNENKYENNKLL